MAVITKSKQYTRHIERWTKAEHKRLRRLYPIHSIGWLSREFGRTTSAISGQAYKLRLKKDVSKGYRGPESDYRLWTEQEIAFLRRHYKGMTFSDIAVAMGRSCSSVVSKAKSFRLRKAKVWTARENVQLKKLYNVRPLRELVGIFGLSRNTISKQARKLEIPKRTKPWTNSQIKYLKKNYGSLTSMELAKRVGRSPGMVIAKARKLGLHKDKDFRKKIHPRGFLISWTRKQIKFLLKHYQTMTAREIASALAKTKTAVQSRAYKLKLKKSKI